MKNDHQEDVLPFSARPGGAVTFLFTDIEGSNGVITLQAGALGCERNVDRCIDE